MVDTVDACTVLVTESVKRSQKLLMAVGQGKPICSPEWIRESKKANHFLGNTKLCCIKIHTTCMYFAKIIFEQIHGTLF